MSERASDMLRVEGLSMSFGGLAVTRDVSLSLAAGDRVALIGPNGAGKTTFVNLVAGLLSPNAGRVLLGGEDVTALGMVERVRRGLVRTFQVTRLFRELTVFENVALPVLQREQATGAIFAQVRRNGALRAEVEELLRTLGLQDHSARPVKEMAYGQQRLVEIAIALALRPKVLLLDEPAAGVPREEASRLLAVIEALPADIAILMIEHDMDLVFRFARRVMVLAAGSLIFEGDPRAVAAHPLVREAYLGNYAQKVRA
jgi:branched-chain amino acid transport system ATP-binding protein